MNVILKRIRDSRNAKMCTMHVFCLISVLIFFSSLSSSSTEDQPQGELLKQKLPLEIRSVVYKEMPGEMMAGGLGAVRENDDQVTEVVHQIKPILERESGKKFEYLQVIHYKPQVVAGTNYFVKARAKFEGEEQIVHLRIYEPINKKLELTAFQLGRKLEDELEYFQ